MQSLIAYATLFMTVGIAVGRPRFGKEWQAGPASAALLATTILLTARVVDPADIIHSLQLHWRPFLMIIATMILSAVAERIGVLERLAEMIFSDPKTTPSRLFGQVFLMCALTSTIFNNDAMIILITPLVLGLVKKRYPGHKRLLAPFAFVVFMAIGVAPFYISNPMNMIVAEFAHVNFNQYASWMIPVALGGWAVTYPIVWLYFRKDLEEPIHTERAVAEEGEGLLPAQKAMLGLLALIVIGYPTVAYFDGPSIWIVAVIGATLAILLSTRWGKVDVRDLMIRTVAWDIFVFLLGVYVIAIALRNVGFTDLLASIYQDANLFVIGGVAAVGSALVNNHPMSLINLMALEALPDAGRKEIFASLIGGDLGPRLLPIGSLAGLLWLNGCKRMGLKVSLRTFVTLGLLVTVPAMGVSLVILLLRGS